MMLTENDVLNLFSMNNSSRISLMENLDVYLNGCYYGRVNKKHLYMFFA